jgi:hydantoinase/carbamoylase family amidase
LVDSQEVALAEALAQAGLVPEHIEEVQRQPRWFHEFVELHIDQADDLDRTGAPLGVITAIAAPSRLWIKIQGQQAHSGATIMANRRDALTGAAEVILAVESIARAYAERNIVGTIGVLRLLPGSMNIVPGLVELGVDIRGVDSTTVEQVLKQVTETTQRIAEERDLQADISVLWRGQPVQIATDRVADLARACRVVGTNPFRLVSRAAHDAMYLGQHGPISMLFVRNPAGISHNPAEDARDEDIILGASALATYIAWRAG